jgi:hypothetical protein
MSSDPAAIPASERALDGTLRAAYAWLLREAGPVSLFCLATALGLLMLPHQLLLDGWLTLVTGREVVTNGLPTIDTLTLWTHGAEWIDQQWLAQAAFYGLWVLGGIKLAMLGHAAVVAITLAAALLAARRLGGSPRNVACAATAALLVAPWAIQMRTQTLVMPLFVALLWLLAADSRTPSRRVFLVFPLLVLWANLHGSVVFAALFVALRGVTYFMSEVSRRPRGWLLRSLALTLVPFACVLASPYGVDLVDYYRSLFFNPAMREIAPEWAASTPAVWTVAFYLVAGGSLWLLARRRSRLTLFEQAALLATIAAGAAAVRSLMWFGLAAMLLVPRLLDEKPARPAPGRAVRLGLASAVVTALLWSAVVVGQPPSWYTSSWPSAAAERVGAIAAQQPGATIFSDGRFASWLLWLQPELVGRVSHDVRWELYTEEQLQAVIRLDDHDGGWRRTVAGYDLLLFDNVTHPAVIEDFRADRRYRTVWSDEYLVVFARR